MSDFNRSSSLPQTTPCNRSSEHRRNKTVLSERQRRELEFYEEFSNMHPPEAFFASIAGEETRPWNSYWQVVAIAKQNFTSEDQKLLDFGCGKGELALVLSKVGYEVFGFDLSPNNIAIAKCLATEYQLTARTHFQVCVAEKLDYPTDYFDVLVGIDILHHVEISQALSECSRVLKKGGVAIFHEPVRVPIFDAVRESRFGRWLVSKEASLEREVTQDERKLTINDIEVSKRIGVTCEHRRHRFNFLD
ncbi:MAG TPA: class I SAM-dependent methyltransferase [Pyrinomonadaceae bacterium]|nr:class I SAM-dependent methyltransferase [Pyrinomonadaceae bacterium]